MRWERSVQVFVDLQQPLVVLTLLQLVLVQSFALLTNVCDAHKFPGQPPVRGWRTLAQPLSELSRVMSVKVFEAYDRVALELDGTEAVAGWRLEEYLAGGFRVETILDHVMPLSHSTGLEGCVPVILWQESQQVLLLERNAHLAVIGILDSLRQKITLYVNVLIVFIHAA